MLTPGIELSDRSERLDANLLLRLNGILYARTSDLSAVDQDYRGRLDTCFHPGRAFRRRQDTAWIPSRTGKSATTGLVLGAVKRHRQQYSLAGELALTEKTSADLCVFVSAGRL